MATNTEIKAWLAANPKATDAEITAAANIAGVSASQLAAATGIKESDVISRMAKAAPAATEIITKAKTTGSPIGYVSELASAPSYFEQRPDVAAAYTPWSGYGSGLTPEQFATAHYNVYGAKEGAAAPTETGGAMAPDYQGKYYDVATLDKLVSGLSKYTNPANLQGGALGTSKGNIGFDYNALTSALGRDITTQDQVLFDAARGLINMGITDPTKVEVKQNTTTSKPDLYYNGQLIKEGIESLNLGSTATGEGITHYSLNLAGEPTFTTRGQKTGGVGFTDIRDLVQAAAVVAGNYFLPGSSLVTSQLVTDGAKEHLSSDLGKAANLVAGASGGIQGNMSNYGKVGETLGLTNPAQVTEAEFLAYDTAAQQAAMGNDFAAIQQNLIASGIDPLDAASIVQTLGTNPGITGAQLAELSGKTVASKTLGSQVGSNTTNTAAGTVGSGIASAVGGSTGGSILGTLGAATTIASGINSLTGGKLTEALGLGEKTPTAAEAQKMADPFSPYRSKLAEMYSGYLTGGNNTDITQMPGYSQFESGVLNPALEATKRAGAKSGMLMSGNEQIALQKQGQTGYYGFMTDYLNRLATASGASVAPAQAANLGLAQGAANAQGVMQGTGAVATGLANLFGTNNTNVASTSSNTVGAGPAGYNWNLGSVDTSSWMD